MSYAGYWEDDGTGCHTSWCSCEAKQTGYSDPEYFDNTIADPGYADLNYLSDPGTVTPPGKRW